MSDRLFYPFPVSTVTEWPGQRPGSYHVGTDFGVPQGTPLPATIDGKIVYRGDDGLGAWVIDILRSDNLLVRNGHLSRMDVYVGQTVTAGQIIGLTGGQRGTPGAGMSTGPHLHWELRWDRAWSGGAWLDPRTLNPQPEVIGQTSKEEKFMRLVWDTNGIGYLVTDDGFYGLPSMEHWNLFKRLIDSTTANPDRFNVREVNMMNDILREMAKRNAKFDGTVTAEVDYGKIAKTVNDDAARRMQG